MIQSGLIKEWDGSLVLVGIEEIDALRVENGRIVVEEPALARIHYEDGLVHEVTMDYLKSVRQEKSCPWAPLLPVVKRAWVDFGSFPQKMMGEMSNGTTEELFRWYPDELQFCPYEVLGRTAEEALALFHERDVNFLRRS